MASGEYFQAAILECAIFKRIPVRKTRRWVGERYATILVRDNSGTVVVARLDDDLALRDKRLSAGGLVESGSAKPQPP